MTDKEDPTGPKKSSLTALPGGATAPAPEKQPQEKFKSKDIHYNIAKAMAGERWGWQPFPLKLYRWTDHMGESVPYAENRNGIVRKVSKDALHHMVAVYWRDVLTAGDRPMFLGTLSAQDLDKTRKLWLGVSKPHKDKFLTLGWHSEPRPALHKMAFDPIPGASLDDCPLFSELMTRTSNRQTLMAWIGSLFDEHSQRQQYAWIYGGGGNGKSALVRVLLNALGPVGASENPPTRDAKHWTVSLSNKRLVVFPDCNNVAFVGSGEFKQLTGEDPVRMEPKGQPVYYETLDAKFMVISNERPIIQSTRADLRRVLFFSVGDLPDAARVENYESQLAAEAPAFLSVCWEVYQTVSGGNSRYEFIAGDQTEINEVVDNAEHEHESFVDGRIIRDVFSTTDSLQSKNYVLAERMKQLMSYSGFRTEYERRKLRDFMERKYSIKRKKVWIDGASRLVYINCRDPGETHSPATPHSEAGD